MPPVMLDNAPECVLQVSQKTTTIELKVTFGDVWLLAGQSNMIFPVTRMYQADKEKTLMRFYRYVVAEPYRLNVD